MAASAANRTNTTIDAIEYLAYDIAASTHIYQFTNVCFDASGNLVQASDTSGLQFAGMARREADNSAGSAGALQAEVIPPNELGCVEMIAASPSNVWLDKIVCFVDDTTVALSAGSGSGTVATTNDIRCGRCIQILDTSATGKVLVDTRDRFAYPAANANR